MDHDTRSTYRAAVTSDGHVGPRVGFDQFQAPQQRGGLVGGHRVVATGGQPQRVARVSLAGRVQSAGHGAQVPVTYGAPYVVHGQAGRTQLVDRDQSSLGADEVFER